MVGKMDLDVVSPDEVPTVLDRAAEAYYASAVELEASWQDKGAGRPWSRIAKILERAAAQVRAALR